MVKRHYPVWKSDETCIEFIYIDNILDEISCRLDLRSLTKTNLISVIEYVQEIGAMFLVGDKIYSPRMEEIIGVMKNQEQIGFAKIQWSTFYLKMKN